MSDKACPSTVIVPRSGGEIVIRQFQPKDASQVHSLLVEGVIYGPESPRNTALHRNLYSPIACACYAGFALGLGCLCMSNPVFQLGGLALCLGASTLFFCVRTAITKMFVHFCSTARNTDMADIPSSYEIPPSMSDRKGSPAQGPGGFWVAVIESPDHKTSEVVGYLGLDYRVNADASSGELRRMTVSMHHRRRKIGSLLIAAVLDHARHLSPPLKTLDLETSEFQPGARKLYENYGFSLVGSRIMRMGPLFSMTVIRLRRRVAE
ncbi:hypothetical protein C8R44DRAFT_845726 [Mycena epipterygia]|nr:hypothetical protein C8R44DRAFT_845726 [Mycena epipterygia]